MSIGRMILTGKQIEVLGVGEGEGCFSATFFYHKSYMDWFQIELTPV